MIDGIGKDVNELIALSRELNQRLDVLQLRVRMLELHSDPNEPPKVGDVIVVDPSDDSCGGLAEISWVAPGMSAGIMVPFVKVKQLPGCSWNWQFLALRQKKLFESYGDQIACEDR